MNFVIENVPVPGNKARSTGFIDAVRSLAVGQSFFADTSYNSAYQGIVSARERKNNPVTGAFRIVKEGFGVRVGRIS